MEKVEKITQAKSLNWFDKHCRSLVHNLLSRLQVGHLQLIEENQSFNFCNEKNSNLSAKVYIQDITAYRDFLKGGSIGVAEAFMAGKWSSPNLTEVIRLFARAQEVTKSIDNKKSFISKISHYLSHWQNRNSQRGAKKNILAHYDLGNDLYTRFLDPSMMYSAAIYPTQEADLATAQNYKLQKICERLELTENEHLLEIGTGWGGLAIYAAQHYGCKVTTTTISDAQFEFAQAKIDELKLEDKITLLKKDYRELTGHYDKVVSIEMIEAVGYEYLQSFFEQCNQRLKKGGKILIQAITIAENRFDYYRNNVDFIQRYIFPGGFLPSVSVLSKQIAKHTQMEMEALHDIGLDYAKTLAHWRDNFLQNWNELRQFGFDENFKRLWLYYFAYCEGGFLERSISTVHLVARK